MPAVPLISIVIATYNSSILLPKVIHSIKRQTIKKSLVEILVVDGGSTDKTVELARTLGCKIIHNKNVEPLYAKYLGFSAAHGKYVMYLDHDEVIVDKHSLQRRLEVFNQNRNLKAVIGDGYKDPQQSSIITSYINEFGDPFSLFMYRLSKNSNYFLNRMNQQYEQKKSTKNYTIYDLSNISSIPLIELAAGGGMIERSFFESKVPNLKKEYGLIAHALYILLQYSPFIAIMKNDPLMHYSSVTLRSYIKKIEWRVRNNIFHLETLGASGFTGRQKYQSAFQSYKKVLFFLYVFCLIPVCIDSMYLIITRKKTAYIIHVFLSYTTACMIVYYYVLKILGYKPQLKSYDGTTKAYEAKIS